MHGVSVLVAAVTVHEVDAIACDSAIYGVT